MAAAPNVQTVAFVGLGRMGLPIAAHILRAGFPLVVWNRTPQKADSLIAAGATLAKSPAEAKIMAHFAVTHREPEKATASFRAMLKEAPRLALWAVAKASAPSHPRESWM